MSRATQTVKPDVTGILGIVTMAVSTETMEWHVTMFVAVDAKPKNVNNPQETVPAKGDGKGKDVQVMTSVCTVRKVYMLCFVLCRVLLHMADL
jgi:hypothetical protein